MCGFLSARARVVELVDTQVSEACASRCSGSSPLPGTISELKKVNFRLKFSRIFRSNVAGSSPPYRLTLRHRRPGPSGLGAVAEFAELGPTDHAAKHAGAGSTAVKHKRLPLGLHDDYITGSRQPAHTGKLAQKGAYVGFHVCLTMVTDRRFKCYNLGRNSKSYL